MENAPSTDLQLEAKVRVLNAELQKTAQENRKLENQLEVLLTGFQKLDFPKLVETLDLRLNRLEQRIEASERHTREELAGRFAVMIEPYLAKTASRLGDFDEQLNGFDERLAAGQKKLEKSHAAHREKLAADGAAVVAEFEARGDALIERWNKGQRTVQANLNQVNEYAKSISGKIADVQHAQGEIKKAGEDFAAQVGANLRVWNEMTNAMALRLERAQTDAAKAVDDASLSNRIFYSRTVGDFKSVVFSMAITACLSIIVFTAIFGTTVYNRAADDIAEVKEFTDQEKQSIEKIFAESVKAASIENTTDNLRIKLYPFLLSRLPAQFKKDFDKELATQVEQLKSERIEKINQQQQKSPPQIAQASAAQ